jgi:hypothetical protein
MSDWKVRRGSGNDRSQGANQSLGRFVFSLNPNGIPQPSPAMMLRARATSPTLTLTP